jgi:hypothetical protein
MRASLSLDFNPTSTRLQPDFNGKATDVALPIVRPGGAFTDFVPDATIIGKDPPAPLSLSRSA